MDGATLSQMVYVNGLRDEVARLRMALDELAAAVEDAQRRYHGGGDARALESTALRVTLAAARAELQKSGHVSVRVVEP